MTVITILHTFLRLFVCVRVSLLLCMCVRVFACGGQLLFLQVVSI